MIYRAIVCRARIVAHLQLDRYSFLKPKHFSRLKAASIAISSVRLLQL